jgi:hypothetical protein
MTEADVQQIIRTALEPLQSEIKALRDELELIKGAPIPEASSSAEVPPSTFPAVPLGASIPPERSDFARFLQRGLEQEQREYTEDADKAPEPKKGWNPFKR